MAESSDGMKLFLGFAIATCIMIISLTIFTHIQLSNSSIALSILLLGPFIAGFLCRLAVKNGSGRGIGVAVLSSILSLILTFSFTPYKGDSNPLLSICDYPADLHFNECFRIFH